MGVFRHILARSFEVLAKGQWPERNWKENELLVGSKNARKAIQPLAGGWRALLVQTAGGINYFPKWWETPRATSHQPCILRRCKFQGHLSSLDNRQSHHGNKLQCCQLLSTSGGTLKMLFFRCLVVETSAWSWIGCTAITWGGSNTFFGSVLHLLVFYLLPQDHLENLWQVGKYIKTHQRQNKSKYRYRMRRDKPTMFQPKKVSKDGQQT